MFTHTLAERQPSFLYSINAQMDDELFRVVVRYVRVNWSNYARLEIGYWLVDLDKGNTELSLLYARSAAVMTQNDSILMHAIFALTQPHTAG